jgi:hypothetical protein
MPWGHPVRDEIRDFFLWTGPKVNGLFPTVANFQEGRQQKNAVSADISFAT